MASEADLPPEITPWGQVTRHVFVAVISAAVCFGAREHGAYTGRGWLVAVDLGLGATGLVVMSWRRRLLLPVAAATSVLTALSATATGPATLAMMSLATTRDVRRISIGAAINLVASVINAVVVIDGDLSEPDELLGIVVPLAAMIGWGMYVGVHRDLIANLRWRAERAEADQERRAGEARAAERTRIAREMHDVVAHHISQVSMRAGALAYRSDLPTSDMRAESEVIRDTANEALRELRSVLQVLRDPCSGGLIDPPQPTYTDITGMVARARASGAHITFVDQVDGPVPNETGRTLYRIVQEGITNAGKHARDAPVTIEAVDRDGGIDVMIMNDVAQGMGSPPGAGLGLIGIGERVTVAGGRLDHGIADGKFTLHAWLPCPP